MSDSKGEGEKEQEADLGDKDAMSDTKGEEELESDMPADGGGPRQTDALHAALADLGVWISYEKFDAQEVLRDRHRKASAARTRYHQAALLEYLPEPDSIGDRVLPMEDCLRQWESLEEFFKHLFNKHEGELAELEGEWKWISGVMPARGGKYDSPQFKTTVSGRTLNLLVEKDLDGGFWFREARVVSLPELFRALERAFDARSLYFVYCSCRKWSLRKPRGQPKVPGKVQNARADRAAAAGRAAAFKRIGQTGRWGHIRR